MSVFKLFILTVFSFILFFYPSSFAFASEDWIIDNFQSQSFFEADEEAKKEIQVSV